MTAQRFTALLLVAISAAAMAYMSLRSLVPAMAVLAALVGAVGWVRFRLRRERELIVVLMLAMVFAAALRTSPYDGIKANGVLLYPFVYTLGLFVLSVMAMKMLVARRGEPDSLPATLPLYGVIVLICAGDVYTGEVRERVYQALTLAFACVTAAYFAAARRATRADPARMTRRRLTVLIALWLAVTGGIVTSTLLFRYQQEMNRLLLRMSLRLRPVGRIGFARDARLGSLDRMKSESQNRTALRVFSRDEPGYLRGLAYERYERSAWHGGGGKERRGPARDLPSALPRASGDRNTFRIIPGGGDRWQGQDVWPSPDLTEAMFTPLHTQYLSADAEELVVDESGTADAVNMPAGSVYTAFVPASAPGGTITANARRRLTGLPELDPRIADLARRIFQGKATAAQKIRAVEDYFHSQHEYALGIRVPHGRDPLAYFLVEKPPAHCEYFATAAAVLLRLGGVPARYVTGFVVREHSDLGGYWLARNRDAHAWVEAWDDSRGWVTVEATPPEGVPHARQDGALAYLWDYLKFRFQELRVMVFAGGPRGLLRWLGDRLLGLGELLIGTFAGRVVLGLLGVLVLLAIRRRLKRRPPRRRVDPLVAAMRRLLTQVDRRLAKHGLVRGEAETLHQFAERLLAAADRPETPKAPGLAPAAQWYLLYARVRYGPHRSEHAVADLRQCIPIA